MRCLRLAISIAIISFPMLAQGPLNARPPRPAISAGAAESALRQAAEQLTIIKKICERDMEVLRHLRTADDALTDPMQPTNAVQKAYEEVDAAMRLNPEFLVMQGVIRAEREVEGARRSPMTADFGHLRSLLRTEALGPASRVVVRDALRLQDETLAWLKVQQLIADHLRAVAEISNQTLRASEQ